MENQDPIIPGTGESQKPEIPAGGGEPSKTPEGFVPKEQFAASQQEAIRLAKELESLKKNPPRNEELPEEKKKVFEYMSEYEQKKAEQAKAEDEKLKSDLDKLHTVHGTFDDKKLISIVDRYGVYDEDGNIQWEKAMELYERLGGQAEYQKKTPVGIRTQDKPLEADKFEVKGKHIHEIVQEGLKRFGIGS